ncbi:hypothetical protein DICVIV_07565 [Dictyocaulus viviparus]|uniref:DUF7087 domain-containing protein n=1 Tax=Dictyocaulus viviparus TaxID=29172 RepID=A0A0D8XRK9_DICVI|nr:hypothetical protein DICVIV_07565 [Dictyocaulus viviparus]
MYNYPNFVKTSRETQIGCILAQIFSLYANSDLIGSAVFVSMTTLCLYNLYVVITKWYNNVDGRFDMRQVFRENDIQLKLKYASEVFMPLIIGILVYSFVNLRSGSVNFIWTMVSCLQITAAVLLVSMEFYEVLILRY